jgi:hypothetical protein
VHPPQTHPPCELRRATRRTRSRDCATTGFPCIRDGLHLAPDAVSALARPMRHSRRDCHHPPRPRRSVWRRELLGTWRYLKPFGRQRRFEGAGQRTVACPKHAGLHRGRRGTLRLASVWTSVENAPWYRGACGSCWTKGPLAISVPRYRAPCSPSTERHTPGRLGGAKPLASERQAQLSCKRNHPWWGRRSIPRQRAPRLQSEPWMKETLPRPCAEPS